MARKQKTRCVYSISNVANGKIYIGSTSDFVKRSTAHRYQLRLGRNKCGRLQAAWDKYGGDVFVFSILELVGLDIDILERESYWIERLRTHDPKFGYNVLRRPASPVGGSLSPEVRKRLADMARGKPNKHAFFANKDRQEKLAKLLLTNLTQKEMAKILGCSVPTLSATIKGRVIATNGGFDWVSSRMKNRQLSKQDVVDIRNMFFEGATCCAIAKRKAISAGLCSAVIRMDRYKDVRHTFYEGYY